ncbi:MAG TPA: hypothetical protein VFV81_06605, partial [Verrucomicrobiae bacterium]|nr:hypothetical protein [Verrucomicrobiae bacterium]
MKRISFWLSVLVLAAVFGVGGTARAQDAATQQQIDKLSGQLQDILDAQAAQGKRIDALEKQVADLSDKLNQPAVNNSASADDLKKLAAQVQEIDQKRQADNQKILDQLEKISRLGAGSSRRSTPAATESAPAPAANIPQTGHYYTI